MVEVKNLFAFLKMLSIALLIALSIRSFIIQPYIIPSDSMLYTLQNGDRIFVTRFSYGLHVPFTAKEIISIGEPQLGDIIVFPYPIDPSVDYIKRVVGLPGDTIEIRDKQLFRNGEPVSESYIVHLDPRTDPQRDNMRPVQVPPGKVFVLGDNRDNSRDSRYWGFVDTTTIRGKAQMIFWSSINWVNISWDRIGKSLY